MTSVPLRGGDADDIAGRRQDGELGDAPRQPVRHARRPATARHGRRSAPSRLAAGHRPRHCTSARIGLVEGSDVDRDVERAAAVAQEPQRRRARRSRCTSRCSDDLHRGRHLAVQRLDALPALAQGEDVAGDDVGAGDVDGAHAGLLGDVEDEGAAHAVDQAVGDRWWRSARAAAGAGRSTGSTARGWAAGSSGRRRRRDAGSSGRSDARISSFSQILQ